MFDYQRVDFSQVEVLDAAAQITGCPADVAKDGDNPAEHLQKFVFFSV